MTPYTDAHLRIGIEGRRPLAQEAGERGGERRGALRPLRGAQEDAHSDIAKQKSQASKPDKPRNNIEEKTQQQGKQQTKGEKKKTGDLLHICTIQVMAGCPLPLKLQTSQASKQSVKIDQRDICEHIPLKPGTDEALYPSGRPRLERVRALGA